MLYAQQKEMYDKHIHQTPDRIVSIQQDHVRPIVRGKVRTKVEFGPKIDVSVYKGFVRLEHASFDAYNESENFKSHVERFFEREKHYPNEVLADKIYRNKEILAYCKDKGIKMLGPALGRPRFICAAEKKKIRKSEIARIEVERKIGLLKGSYSMKLNMAKLKNTSLTMIAISILAMNIAYAVRVLFVFINTTLKSMGKMILDWLYDLMIIYRLQKNWV